MFFDLLDDFKAFHDHTDDIFETLFNLFNKAYLTEEFKVFVCGEV